MSGAARWMPLVACLLLTACAKAPDAPPPPPPSAPIGPPGAPPAAATATTPAAADLESVQPATKPLKLALVVKTRNNPFFTPMIEAAEAEAKALGVELEVQAPPQETDKEQQFALVQQLVAKGVDAILIAPADSKGIVPVLVEAEAKGILVINVDNRIDQSTAEAQGLELGGYVGADNEAGGELAGRKLAELLPAGSKVALLEGIRGADNAESRKRGFEAAASGKLEIVARESAEWDTAKAYAKFQNMLAAHPDITGLFCANDKMALGALQAIDEAKKGGTITVVGYDNIPDVQDALQAGTLAATIEQHPDLMGRFGVRMAVAILDQGYAKGTEYLVELEVIAGGPPAGS